MEHYLIKISNRLPQMETECQVKTPDLSIFLSLGAAIRYCDDIVSEPFKFSPSQVSFFKINLTIVEEIPLREKR